LYVVRPNVVGIIESFHVEDGIVAQLSGVRGNSAEKERQEEENKICALVVRSLGPDAS
jgi:hypothetical protein